MLTTICLPRSGAKSPATLVFNWVGATPFTPYYGTAGRAGRALRAEQDAYARAGVREYWIADPHARSVELLFLEGGAYQSAGVFA